LNGDRITDFSSEDQIFVSDASFETSDVSAGSGAGLVLVIDTDQNGVGDLSITLEGLYPADVADFSVLASGSGTILFYVEPLNEAPVAGDDTLSVPAGKALRRVDLLANDSDLNTGDALSITAISGSAIAIGGSVVLSSGAEVSLNADGTIDYTPAMGFTGADTFTYTLSDDDGATADAAVNLTVDWTADQLAAWAEIVEDSNSPGGAGNANGVLVTDDQLALLAERVLAGSDTAASPMEARYQAAIQAATNFSDLPSITEIQALIDAENSNINRLFNGQTTFNESYVADWDMSQVTNIWMMFYNNNAFNQDISGWNVSNVTSGGRLFTRNVVFDQDIGDWDVGSFTNMDRMFYGAGAFNQDIGDWDVGAVTNMAFMFTNAASFNQDIGSWDVSNVTSMWQLFYNAPAFDQEIGAWNVSSVTNLGRAFGGATVFNGDVSGWNVANVTNMERTFINAKAFNHDLGDWDVGKVTTMSFMFYGASAFDQDLGDWDISSLTNAANAFDFSGISQENFDKLLAGWSVLDTTAGETAINSGVTLGSRGMTYTDATSHARLVDTYNWFIDGATLASGVTVGTSGAETLSRSSSSSAEVLHGLGGADVLIGGSGNDELVGGAGNDSLTGGAGADRFVFKFEDAGDDTITDYQVGVDQLDFAQLVIGYAPGVSSITDFVTLSETGGHAKLTIDRDGTGAGTSTVSVTLEGVQSSAVTLQTWIDDGELLV
ncbi:MAG: BspA family leucine-rich repeat surface protein, partial [Pseudomonadota bacterium]